MKSIRVMRITRCPSRDIPSRPALIDRVRGGGWDPEHHEDDRKSRDALAARGYWQAFQKVKATVAEVIVGGNAGTLVRTAHNDGTANCSSPALRRD